MATSKKKFTGAQEMLRHAIKRRPGEEDFWIFAVITDDPERPTWNERYLSIGTYEQAVKGCAALMETLVRAGVLRQGKFSVMARQGDGARRLFADGMRQESKYRQEIKAQPNN